MNLNFNSSRKGMVLPIILLVIFILAGVGFGGYYLIDTFVLFPDSDDDALSAVLEHKLGLGFEFEPIEDQGKLDLSVKFTEESITAYVKSIRPNATEDEIKQTLEMYKNVYPVGEDYLGASVSYKENNFAADLTIMNEKLHLISGQDDLVIGVDGFNDGKYYGVSTKTFVEDFAASLFAPGSGAPCELPQEAYDSVIELYESYMDLKSDEGFKADAELVEEIILDCFKNSKLGECEVKFFDNTFNGTPHAGRSQNFVFTREGFINFLEVLSARLQSLSDEEKAAVENLLSLTEMMNSGEAYEISGIVDGINNLLEQINSQEPETENRINVSVIYVAKNLAAIEISAFSKNIETQEEKQQFYFGLDFGDKPLKDTKATMVVKTFGESKPLDLIIESNKVVEGGKTSVSISVSIATYGFTNTYDPTLNKYISGYEFEGYEHTYIEYSADKNEGLISFAISKCMDDEEKTELMRIELGYADSKDTLSISTKSYTQNGRDAALPYELTIAISNTPNEIVIPEYDNFIKYDAPQLSDLLTELKKYLQETFRGAGSAAPRG